MGSTARPRPWLTDAEASAFLTHCWQKNPRFFAAALPDLPDAPDWRALAADPDVESRRIVTSKGPRYRSEPGPFGDRDPDEPWTVLLQDVDWVWPPLRDLFATLPFLPRWRTEDVMMSIAADGGSVGPHVDRYDVFLVQATGERHWQVGEPGAGVADPAATDLRLVAPFEPAFEVTAGPGDVLYLPPGVPHHGVARGPCTTYSIGFRAPSLQDLAAVALTHVDSERLLTDADRTVAPDPMAMDRATIAALRQQLATLLDDEHALAHALGELVTEPKAWLAPEPPDAIEPVHAGDRFRLAAGSRLATWLDGTVFVNGAGYAVSSAGEHALIAALQAGDDVRAGQFNAAGDLIEALLADGALVRDQRG